MQVHWILEMRRAEEKEMLRKKVRNKYLGKWKNKTDSSFPTSFTIMYLTEIFRGPLL